MVPAFNATLISSTVLRGRTPDSNGFVVIWTTVSSHAGSHSRRSSSALSQLLVARGGSVTPAPVLSVRRFESSRVIGLPPRPSRSKAEAVRAPPYAVGVALQLGGHGSPPTPARSGLPGCPIGPSAVRPQRARGLRRREPCVCRQPNERTDACPESPEASAVA